MIEDGEAPQDPVLARVRPPWNDARTERNLSATLDRIDARSRRRAWSRVMAGGAVVLLVGGVVGGLLHQSRSTREVVTLSMPRPKSAAVASPAPAHAHAPAGEPAAALAASPIPDAIRLRDGSEVRPLDARARIDIIVESADRVEVGLHDGPAVFDVVPGRARSFVVRSGRVQLTVLGTRFQVNPEGDGVHLAVERGRVRIDWPGGRDVAGPGTDAWFPPREREPLAVLRSRFQAYAARRDYAAAYRSLVSTPAVIKNSAEDLMLAADAARLSGHAAESAPYFERLLRDHAKDARAPLAAFTFGRILLAQLGRPAEAADMFGLARRLDPSGALASDALARETEAAAEAGDRARARRLALEFVSRYPSGRRVEAVRRSGGLE
jgi:transmembrane sensor